MEENIGLKALHIRYSLGTVEHLRFWTEFLVISEIILLGDATTQELQVIIKAIARGYNSSNLNTNAPDNAKKRNFDLPWTAAFGSRCHLSGAVWSVL